MKKHLKKIINQSDWKKFEKWVASKTIFFNNSSFYTDLININYNKNYSNSFWEFYVFNLKELNNSYTFFDDVLTEEEKNIKFSGDELDYFLKLITLKHNETKKEWKLFFSFLNKLVKYLEENKKDYDYEYVLVQDYWKFINSLVDNKIQNFNNWIIYINNNIYTKSVGFLKT